MSSNLSFVKFIEIRNIQSSSGHLAFLEQGTDLDFEIKRIYYIFGVNTASARGGHAHKALAQVFIPISGSFRINLFDGVESKSFVLDCPTKALYVPPKLWRTLDTFEAGSVCLVIASECYSEEDYIRELDQFVLWQAGEPK